MESQQASREQAKHLRERIARATGHTAQSREVRKREPKETAAVKRARETLRMFDKKCSEVEDAVRREMSWAARKATELVLFGKHEEALAFVKKIEEDYGG